MSKTKYSPSPWTIRAFPSREQIGDATYKVDVMSKDRRIAGVTIRSDLPFIANAQLIAEAPRLLSEMKSIMAVCEERRGDVGEDALRNALHKITDRAERAIAKATGGDNE